MNYGTELLSDFRIQRAKLNMESYSSADLPPAYAFLLLAVHLSRADRPTIVDFGGACGEWAHVLATDATRPFQYTIVENPDLVRRCSSDPFFGWARWTCGPVEACDIFSSSGTLNFVEDPFGILGAAFASAREYVVLGRNCFCETDIYRIHESLLTNNGSGERIPDGYSPNQLVQVPHGTMSLRRVLEVAANDGWALKLHADCQSGVLPFRGQTFGGDLLFAKMSPKR